jgi:hypothetical protein
MSAIRLLAVFGQASVLLLSSLGSAGAAQEQAFPLLQIGTRTYTNVTVTTKAKSYIFLLHATGMLNVKVADLAPEVREKLGYTNQPPPVSKTRAAGAWAQRELARIQNPQLQRLQELWRANSGQGTPGTPRLNPAVVQGVVALLVCAYLFICYCGLLICRKTGHEPGWLIWVPILQLFPLLRSAGMAQWWFVAFLVPVLNLLAHVLWSVKIVQARAKSLWVALLLLLPVTNVFALSYLAFSSAPAPKKRRVVEIMTLETF